MFSLFLLYWFQLSTWLFPVVYSSLWVCFFFFSRAFRSSVNSLVWLFSSFFIWALSAMYFSIRPAFKLSHRFGYVVLSFSLNSMKWCFLSLLLPLPRNDAIEHCSIPKSLWGFCNLCYFWILILSHGCLKRYRESFHFFNLFVFALLPSMWSILEKTPCGVGEPIAMPT